MALLDLDPDQLLSTTRAVRKRLDLTRDVPDDLIRECVAMAQQAPSGSNLQNMRFVVVKDAGKRKAVADVYAQCFSLYRQTPFFIGSIPRDDAAEHASQQRSADSASYLADHMAEVPVLVIGGAFGLRADNQPAIMAATVFGNAQPAMWSFMLAARARGLGTAWTSLHLMMEREVADILGIPFDSFQQVCLTPLAFTVGTGFKPALRPAPDTVIHWDGW